MRNAWPRALSWGILSLMIALLDQGTKQCITQVLMPYQSVRIWPFFDITLVFNTGAAFNFLSHHGHASNLGFLAFALLAMVVACVMLYRLPHTKTAQALGLSLILGGALGNVIDRVRLGAVVDFLSFHAGDYYWPAFNLADSAICLGVIVMIVEMIFTKAPRR